MAKAKLNPVAKSIIRGLKQAISYAKGKPTPGTIVHHYEGGKEVKVEKF